MLRFRRKLEVLDEILKGLEGGYFKDIAEDVTILMDGKFQENNSNSRFQSHPMHDTG